MPSPVQSSAVMLHFIKNLPRLCLKDHHSKGRKAATPLAVVSLVTPYIFGLNVFRPHVFRLSHDP